MSNLEIERQIPQTKSCKSYRYRIEQTPHSALIAVSRDALEEVVADYTRLRVRLEQERFKIALEE
jgi:hypothetical protein